MIHTARDIAATTYAPPSTRAWAPEPLDIPAICAWMVRQRIAQTDYADHKGARSCPPGHNCQHRLGAHAAAAKRSRDKRKP